jgi:hypothetical protein
MKTFNKLNIDQVFLLLNHLFRNNFPDDQKKNITITESEIKKNVYDDKTIFYNINSNGFRCSEIEIKKTILFSGCSETFGTSLNQEDTWPNLLFKNLNKKDYQYINLAREGAMLDSIISDILLFSKKFLYPEYIFLLLPPIGRGPFLKDGKIISKEGIDHYSEINENPTLLSRTVTSMILFEEWCKINKINLFWSTWNTFDQEIFSKIKILKRFVSTEISKKDIDQVLNNSKNIKNLLARDKTHSGKPIHEHRSKVFLEKVKNDNSWN